MLSRCRQLRATQGLWLLRYASPTAMPAASQHHQFHQARLLSTKDIFGNVDLSLAENLSKIPLPPAPFAQKPSVSELFESGQSVLSELGLFTWWKPSGYIRWALEYIHMNFDMPWWATIICGTCLLRLALIYVPIMSQKFVSRQSQYTPEIAEFQRRAQDAKRENNSLLIQQILIEQRDFLRSKDIRYGRQALIMGANATVFLTQFFAIKKLVSAGYPGLDTGGVLWFTDLTACDPYYVLPIISSLTMSIVMRFGLESGQSVEQMNAIMRLGMIYGMPLVVLITSSQFSSAVCLYWCTSNAMSLAYTVLFKVPVVRRMFNLPEVKKMHAVRKNSVTAAWKDYQAQRNAPPSIDRLRELDAKQFKKAGRGKPAVKVD